MSEEKKATTTTPIPPDYMQHRRMEATLSRKKQITRTIYRSLSNCPFLLRTQNPYIQMLNMYVNIYKAEKCKLQYDNFAGKSAPLNYIHKFVATPTSRLVKKIYTTNQRVNVERYAAAVLTTNPRRAMISRLNSDDIFRPFTSKSLDRLDSHLNSNHTFMDNIRVRSIQSK